jgi:hypothetical protein
MSHGSEGPSREREAREPPLKLREADLASRGFEDEAVVLDLRNSTYLATNPTATLLWNLLERGTTRGELIAALVAHFEVDELTASPDVDAFLADCRRRGLLQEPPGS